MKPIITTKQGAVQGTLSQDGKALIFRGVPYAQPPVGSLPLCPPPGARALGGPRDCTQFSPRCPPVRPGPPWTFTARNSMTKWSPQRMRTACT